MSLLGLTLLLKDFALILFSARCFSSWGEQKSLKQPKILGKIGGENGGSPQVKTVHIYRRMVSVIAWKPAQMKQPAVFGAHSDRLHSTPACPQFVQAWPGCVCRHPGGLHRLTLSILRSRRYPMPHGAGAGAECLLWSPAAF